MEKKICSQKKANTEYLIKEKNRKSKRVLAKEQYFLGYTFLLTITKDNL